MVYIVLYFLQYNKNSSCTLLNDMDVTRSRGAKRSLSKLYTKNCDSQFIQNRVALVYILLLHLIQIEV